MNTPVSFELAKLVSRSGYSKDKYNHEHNEREWDMFGERIKEIYFPFPTISEVVMWLYEKHGIWIQPYQTDDNNDAYPLFWGEINNRGKIIESTKFGNWFNSPTEAYEAAIKYTLENII